MINIVSSIICTTFENEIKRWQCRNEKQFAMKVSFSLSLDYDKEEGYRNLDILIFAPMNYVGVLVRERWTIVKEILVGYLLHIMIHVGHQMVLKELFKKIAIE